MTARKKRGHFNYRSFITFTVVSSFLVITITGAILYLTPQGRMAHWTGWRIMMLDKEQWSALHINTCILFLVAAGLHIYLNWRVLFSYIRTRAVAGFRRKWEFATAVILTSIFVVTTLGAVPPLSFITDWNEDIKTYWAGQVRTRAPVPHAETMPLRKVIAGIDGMTSRDAIATLRAAGFDLSDATITLEELADQKGLSPMAVYELLGRGTLLADSGGTPRTP